MFDRDDVNGVNSQKQKKLPFLKPQEKHLAKVWSINELSSPSPSSLTSSKIGLRLNKNMSLKTELFAESNLIGHAVKAKQQWVLNSYKQCQTAGSESSSHKLILPLILHRNVLWLFLHGNQLCVMSSLMKVSACVWCWELSIMWRLTYKHLACFITSVLIENEKLLCVTWAG